jgi:Fe-Mn family superoxide dismutase
MRKVSILISSILPFVVSCNNKKLTEVVEVPLPTAQEKVTIDSEDVKANKGSFQLESYLIDMMH